MFTLIKILVLLLVSFLTYDTINFFLESSEVQKLKSQQVEVRQEYETVEVTTKAPAPEKVDDEDDIVVLGMLMFVVVTGVCGVAMIFSKFKRGGKVGKIVSENCLINPHDQLLHVKPMLSYYVENNEEDYSEYGADNPRLMRTHSEVQLATSPYIDLAQDLIEEDDHGPLDWREDSKSPSKTGGTEEEEIKTVEWANSSDKNPNDSLSIIDFNLLSINTSLSVQNTWTKQDEALTQTEPTLICECPLEKFEERLGAVEDGLKTNREAQALWSSKIEQAEMDIVNLHRQMYTILSKAEFTAPSSDIFSKTVGDTTPTDFQDANLYKIPDIILETKNELEKGDLFKKSLTTDDNESEDDLDDEKWKLLMERELTAKIRELTKDAEQEKPIQPINQAKLKEEILKKNEQVKEKTKSLFESMEEVLRTGMADGGSTLKKSKLSVHSHYVAPYRRIQNAETDNFNPSSLSNNQNHKVKPKLKIK